MPNVYSTPEYFGLKIIEESDVGQDYSFDRMIVLADEATGEMFYATDSGCSCPSPFEDLTSRDQLTKIGPESMEAFEVEAKHYFSAQDQFSIRSRVRLQRAAAKAVRQKGASRNGETDLLL